jgi:hypothetical protein
VRHTGKRRITTMRGALPSGARADLDVMGNLLETF